MSDSSTAGAFVQVMTQRAITLLHFVAFGILGVWSPPFAHATDPIWTPARTWTPAHDLRWPDGTEVMPFENLEGVMFLTATVRGLDDRDTTGLFVLDTGAGYLALDVSLARWAGVVDSSDTSLAVNLARRPLPRFALGALSMDQVEPVLTIDVGVVRRVTDRDVLGLLGQKPLGDRALWIDYQAGQLALVPSRRADPEEDDHPELSRRGLASLLSPAARAIAFRLAGDGKIVVQGRLQKSGSTMTRWLNWIVDTGASKCVLFESTLDMLDRPDRAWPALHGLTAPTLMGDAEASLARVPAIELRGVAQSPASGSKRILSVVSRAVDVALIESELQDLLSRVTGETIDGLIGYSLLKRYRVVFDYPLRIMWLDPIPSYRDDRPYEHSHVGIQLERRARAIEVAAVVVGSPAAQFGLATGDRLVALDGASVDSLDLVTVTRQLEGPPGTFVLLTIRRGDLERTVRLRRRRLL